jgi:hypothetical protein
LQLLTTKKQEVISIKQENQFIIFYCRFGSTRRFETGFSILKNQKKHLQKKEKLFIHYFGCFKKKFSAILGGIQTDSHFREILR